MPRVLITGGTGLVGTRLTEMFLDKGYKVCVLSRTENLAGKIKKYRWSIYEGYIDPEAILNTDYIVHLAGAGITDKRWTDSRKKVILDSRIKSAELLLEKVKHLKVNLKGFISSSGTGYYGAITSDKIFSESDSPAKDFAAQVCVQWEDAANQFAKESIRTTILRTGVVLSEKGGVIKKLKPIFNIGFGSALGKGKQYFPWIHIDDLCAMYIHAIENETVSGIYNAVATEHVTNKQFSKAFAKSLSKPFWAPAVPSFVMKLMLGEMAEILLEGSRVSNEKILECGLELKFSDLEEALK